jgi:glycogen debranching enzyme
VRLQIVAQDFEDCIDFEDGRQRELRLSNWQRRTTAVTSEARSPFTQIVSHAIHDVGSFALLDGAEDEWLAPGAGVPAYLALWGRDALTAVWQSALFDRGAMAEAALARTAALQGQITAPERDEQPGRLIHSSREGPLERLGRTPFDRYYGDQASPFDFIFALAHAYACSGEKRLLTRHWDAARRILDWARECGDSDGDGYLEYLTHSQQGPENQGWKDSGNAMVHGDGRKALAPLAACEVQGYYFAALQIMAGLSGLLREPATAITLWRQANELRERFNRDFWMEDEGFIALALDSDKKQLRTMTSNVGQCLATGIISKEHLQRVIRRLFDSDLFSGWGIRTLSTRNPTYNPLDYHLDRFGPSRTPRSYSDCGDSVSIMRRSH